MKKIQLLVLLEGDIILLLLERIIKRQIVVTIKQGIQISQINL